MRHAFEPPRLGMLVAEYLVWSFAVAAVPAVFLTMGVLKGDPEDIYDEQAETVRALAGGALIGLLFVSFPLALIVLWRLAVRGSRALLSVTLGKMPGWHRTMRQALPATTTAAADSAARKSKPGTALWSWLRLCIEYASMVFLTPTTLATVGLGDPQHAYDPGDPYARYVHAFAVAPGALIAMRTLLVFLILGLLRTGRIAQGWMSGCSDRSARGRGQ